MACSSFGIGRLLGLAALLLWASGCDCGAPGTDLDGGDDAGPVEDAGGDAGAPDDGGVDGGPVELKCNSCHGNEANAAPPRDADGGSDRNSRTVGAHQAHLADSVWHRRVLCEDCHVVPQHIEDPGHLDPSPAEMVFGAVPMAGGATPTWDTGALTCSNWCHGQKLTGGALTVPGWTITSSAQAYCGNCHGIPPPAPHPQGVGADCSSCHPTARPGLGFSAPERHVDGVVDVSVSCDSCHGGSGDPAPPRDTRGATSTTVRGVGAHRSHLGPSTWHHELQCTDCHQVPQAVDDPGHLDTPLPAELTWSSLATARGATPAWDGVTCSVYCHGQTIDGGTLKVPTWTAPGTGQAACGTCHSLPPGGNHPNNPQCWTCHSAVLAADGGFRDANLHINGLVEAAGGCGSCHDLPPQTGAHLKHAGLAQAVYGSTDTAASLTNPTGYAFGCGHCHPVDSSHHMNGGRAEVELYNPAASGLKALNPPTASYTPGGQVFTDGFNLQYTEGTCANVYCHSGPTYATPGGVPRPGVDFTFNGYPIAYPAYTLTVARSYASVGWGGAAQACSSCHGFPIRSAVPTVQAMAGQSHSFIDAAGYESGHGYNHKLAAPLSCRTCHVETVTAQNATARDSMDVSSYGPVPIVGFGRHVNGRPDVVFDTANAIAYPTPKTLTTASYSQATSTCTNVACHLAQTAVRHGTPYRYDVTDECNACHQL